MNQVQALILQENNGWWVITGKSVRAKAEISIRKNSQEISLLGINTRPVCPSATRDIMAKIIKPIAAIVSKCRASAKGIDILKYLILSWGK